MESRSAAIKDQDEVMNFLLAAGDLGTGELIGFFGTVIIIFLLLAVAAIYIVAKLAESWGDKHERKATEEEKNPGDDKQ